jgi:hypothetical protein
MNRNILFFLVFFLLVFCFSQISNAQTVDDLSPEQIINVEVVPQTPGSNQNVSIEIKSYSYDLSRAKISWYLNGVLKDSGIGKQNFNFITGEAGTVSNIVYKITTSNGIPFEKKITISPSDVTLLWESSGYTHPFYKGKPMFSFEGSARIIAIPNILNSNGVKYKAEELVYTWKRGMGTDTGASGYGKNIFFWNGDVVSTRQEISVEVTDLKKTTKAVASITIEPKEAEVLIYEDNPSLGVLWNKAINNTFDLVSTEVSFIASPYYFNNATNDSINSWFVNGQKSPETSYSITLRNTTGGEGYSNISFDISNQKRIMQSANTKFSIFMKKEGSSTSIFKNFFGE